MNTTKKYLTLLIILFLVSCSKATMEGTYTFMGVQEFEFRSDGIVVQSVMGSKAAEHKYELDGNEVKIQLTDGSSLILTILDNGDIQGPANMILTLKK